jgi:hypothetical protein
MNWAKRLKRVFGLEIDTGRRCGGTLRIIGSIHQPELPLGARAPPVPAIGRCRPTRRFTMQTGSGRGGG